MRTRDALRGLALLLCVASAGFGQLNLNTATKVQWFNLGLQAASGQLEKQQVDQAKYILLALGDFVQTVQRAAPDAYSKYTQLCGTAWPEAITEANAVQAATAMKQAVDEFRPKLTTFAQGMDFFQPHQNLSFEQWANYVVKARVSAAEAEKCGVAFAAKSPQPLLYFSQFGMNSGAYSILHTLCIILVAEPLANEYAQKDILPRALAAAEKKLADVPADTKHAGTLIMLAEAAQEELGFVLAIDPKNERAKVLGKQADAVIERANQLYAAQVAENRMPSDSYTGPGAGELRGQLEKAYRAAFPDEKLVKLTITSSDWVERAEAWWQGEVLRSGVFRYVAASVAVEKPEGKVRVFNVTFARDWTGRGDDFGAPYYARTAGSYEMLKANL